MKKYLFSIICTLLPIFASAQEPYAVMIDGNTAIEFRYDNEKAARGGMDIGPFSSAGERPWDGMTSSIYSVVFDESFANYTSLTSTAYWFHSCTTLETIIGINYLNTSNVTDMSNMFAGCGSLQSLDVSSFNTEKVTNMAYAFSGLINLESLNLGNLNTSNVTDMRGLFDGCSKLSSLDVGSFNTEKVTNMRNMFAGLPVTSLDLSSFNTSSVTDMGWMFSGCMQLTTILVGRGWVVSTYTSGEAMFLSCEKLVGQNGTTYDFNFTDQTYAHVDGGVSNPGYLSGEAGPSDQEEAQYWMELESTLQYADDLYGRARDNSNVEQWMLEELSEFMNRGSDMLDAHEADEQEVRHMIEEINYICWEIEEAMNRQPEPSEGPQPYAIFIDNNTALEFRYDDQWSAYREAMMIYPFSSTVDRGWNDMAESIHSVVFNESFANCTSITSTEYWFFGCSNLETFIGLENLNTSNVTNMASMFDGCYSLTSLDLSSFNTTSVTEMKMMFYGCTNLTTIYVRSGWSTANVRSSDYMFEGCDRIVGGRGTQWDPDHVDAAYAHVDGGANNPGYLTDPYAEPSGEGEARFDGLTAWVYGDKTLDDAFAEVGRESATQTIAAIVWEGTDALTAEQMQGITNPNLLVYVNEASKAPAGVQNIIVNGSAAQIVLTDASGNNNFHCPQSFTAQSISYTRNFSQTTEIGVSRGWETIALPFNVQSISHSHGALVPFGGGNGGYPFWLHQLQDNSLSPVTVMEANTPYLICMPNNKVYPSAYNQAGNVTFASSNVTVPETHPHEGFAGNVMLIPAFQSVEASPDIYTLNVGEASGSYAEGSVFISNYRSVRPFQAYTVHTNGARGEDIRYIPLSTLGGGTDGTTGIMEILQPAGSDAGAWYSLDGRKLDAKPTRKGVYIQNGKKIVIK